MCWRPRELSCENSVAHLVRSLRTYARIRSLTTGTFNQVVKDRNRIPPERREFSPEGHTQVRIHPSSKPYKHTALRKTLSTHAPHRISTRFPQREFCWSGGRPRPLKFGDSQARSSMVFRSAAIRNGANKRMLFWTRKSGRQKIDKRTCFGGPCFEGTLQESCNCRS